MKVLLIFLFMFISCGRVGEECAPCEPLPGETPDEVELPDPGRSPDTPEPSNRFCPPNSLSFREKGPFDIRTSTGTGYSLYLPRNIEECESPLIFWNNGTGASCSFYNGQLRHWASWGYTVVCARTSQSGDGKNCFDSYQYVKGKTKLIGIGGHSQGGAGAMSCAARFQRAFPDLVYALAPVEPAFFMGPSGQNPGITGHKFVTSGSRDSVVPASGISRGYRILKGPKVHYSMVGASHMNSQSWMGEGGVAFFNAALLKYPEAIEYFDNTMLQNSRWKKLE